MDKTRGAGVKTGDFVYLPDMPHSLWNGDEITVLPVNGAGPFMPKYVNPNGDPSGQSMQLSHLIRNCIRGDQLRMNCIIITNT
ncbi:hypothetical protein [Chenggangzhangella methanolivorans]|uniref:Uncharacterized protein n=1 Tax=Chenggangzhangella methanolivorans TaxID=1437009 RepID=A0A9E6UHR1_9HYPH|nr:hypothetical protein [Chenggangzhangella methanolivorans]QZO00018.1 hypothetical protein K6K41_26110 [Chenggangzhangella methanolivorans]